MGFFDEYKDSGAGGTWIGKDEKAELIANGVPLVVTAISQEDHSDYGERYIADVTLPDEYASEDGETARQVSFPKGTVESRDRMLDAMEKWLDDPTHESPTVKLEKVGRSIIVSAFEAV